MGQVYVGMPESEFKQKVEGEELVSMDNGNTVYKVQISTYNDALVLTRGTGWRHDHRFFYFYQGKLKSINKGERSVDYRLRVN